MAWSTAKPYTVMALLMACVCWPFSVAAEPLLIACSRTLNTTITLQSIRVQVNSRDNTRAWIMELHCENAISQSTRIMVLQYGPAKFSFSGSVFLFPSPFNVKSCGGPRVRNGPIKFALKDTVSAVGAICCLMRKQNVRNFLAWTI